MESVITQIVLHAAPAKKDCKWRISKRMRYLPFPLNRMNQPLKGQVLL
jgi:hypothetical protein